MPDASRRLQSHDTSFFMTEATQSRDAHTSYMKSGRPGQIFNHKQGRPNIVTAHDSVNEQIFSEGQSLV